MMSRAFQGRGHRVGWTVAVVVACLACASGAWAGRIIGQSSTHQLATGDFDGNGAADAAWLLPNGDIQLLSPATGMGRTIVGANAYAVVGADLTDGGDLFDEVVYLKHSHPSPTGPQEIRAFTAPTWVDTQLPGSALRSSVLTSGDWNADGDDGVVVTGSAGNLYGSETTPGGIVWDSPSNSGQLVSWVGGDFNPGRAGDEFAGFNAGTVAYRYNGGTSNSWTAMNGSGLNAINKGNVNAATAGDEVVASVRGTELWRWNQTGWARLPGGGVEVGAGSLNGGLDEWLVIGNSPNFNLWRYQGNTTWVPVGGANNVNWGDFVAADFDGDGNDEVIAFKQGDMTQPYYFDPGTMSDFQTVAVPPPAPRLPVSGGNVLWLDASDPTSLVLDGSGKVDTWIDKSGSGNHAAQPSTDERPTPNATALNGQPAVRFDGIDDGLLISDGLSLGRPYTAIIVDQYYGGIQGRTLQGRDANWLTGKWGGNNAHYANGFVYSAGAGTGNAAIGDAVGAATASEYVLNGRNVTTNAAPTGSPGRLGLVGEGLYPAEVSQADVAEVIVFDRVLGYHERALVGQYLGQKYGIPTEYRTDLATKAQAFAGADPGEGLDFQGTFVHAVNVRGPGGMTVGDATFTDDTGVVTAENEILNWISPVYGPSADDAALATVMQSIRWTATGNGGQETLDANLPGLVPGNAYKVQMLFGETTVTRHFGVDVEGSPVLRDFQSAAMGGGNGNLGVVLSHQFIAGDDTLNVVLNGAVVGGGDLNPLLQGITVEDLGIVGRTTVGTFSGGDSGEGLDLEGKFLYAVNVGGPGGFSIGNAIFTADTATPGLTLRAENHIPNWGAAPNFGATANDNNLETVMHSIRWVATTLGGQGDLLSLDLEGLVPGLPHRLQLLFDERGSARGFDVTINGILVADDFNPGLLAGLNDPTLGAVLTYDFIADADTLSILLDGYSSPFGDHNPILQGFTLEVIPEPTTLALLGLGALALARRRRRRAS